MTLLTQENDPLQQFIVRSADDQTPILQRVNDGYINATALCKATGKLFADYLRLGSTTSFLAALEADMGIPISDLIHSRRGGTPSEQGTWVHPHIAINLAQWASAEFAVKVSRWVSEWLRGELVEKPTPESNPFNLIIQQAKAALELERRQMVLDRRQTSIEQRQDVQEERMEELFAKIESVAGGPDCYAVKGYAKRKGISLPASEARNIGLEATRLCKERGELVGTADDELFGTVNTYPEAILSMVFFRRGLFDKN